MQNFVFVKRWYGFSVFVSSINLFSPSLYLSPREFGLRYSVIFMTSRGCRAGINESCRITLTLVVRTSTCFLRATTRKRERTYFNLLFHLTAFYRVPRLSTSARCQCSLKELIHRISRYFIVTQCETMQLSFVLVELATLHQLQLVPSQKDAFFIIAQYILSLQYPDTICTYIYIISSYT